MYLAYYSYIVDNTHIISNGVVKFPMNEAIEITDEDYLKFKKELALKKPAALEKEKDEDFQRTFKDLWPNAYSRLNDKDHCSSVILEKLNKEKHEELLRSLKETSCKYCLSDPKTIMCSACRQVCYHKASTCQPTTKLIHDYSCIHYVPTVSHVHTCGITSAPSYFPRTIIHSSDISYAKLPELVSVYDRPFLTPNQKEDLVKSSYNKECISEEVKLLQNLKDDNEKLRLRNKVEKTNDIVDNIISKVSVLQADLKKKSAEIKIKEEMMKLEHEYHHSKRDSCLKSILKHRSKSPCHGRERSMSPCYKLDRSSSRNSRCRERSSSRHSEHRARSSSRHSSCHSACRDRSSSRHSERSPLPKSSKLPHHHHYYDYKSETLSSTSDCDKIKQNRYWKSWKDVPSRVDSWKCVSKDSKIY